MDVIEGAEGLAHEDLVAQRTIDILRLLALACELTRKRGVVLDQVTAFPQPYFVL